MQSARVRRTIKEEKIRWIGDIITNSKIKIPEYGGSWKARRVFLGKISLFWLDLTTSRDLKSMGNLRQPYRGPDNQNGSEATMKQDRTKANQTKEIDNPIGQTQGDLASTGKAGFRLDLIVKRVWVMLWVLSIIAAVGISRTLPAAGGAGAFQVTRINQIRLSLPDGKEVARESDREYGFWTPSKDTAKDIQDGSDAPGEKRHWQTLKSVESTNILFGEILSGRKKHRDVDWKKAYGIKGWRRTVAYGSGSKARKDGYWWTMTVGDNFDIHKFATLYAEVWYAEATPNELSMSKYRFPDEQHLDDRTKDKEEEIFIEEYIP
jgi:hypothetical protein